MATIAREFGLIGLGRMGGNLALQAREKGMRVVGFAREPARPELHRAGLEEVRGYDELRDQLSPPRAIFLYVPAGPPVDQVLDELAARLDPGDVVVDGGNSYWGDSIRR